MTWAVLCSYEPWRTIGIYNSDGRQIATSIKEDPAEKAGRDHGTNPMLWQEGEIKCRVTLKA
jgi:hypothetical protein